MIAFLGDIHGSANVLIRQHDWIVREKPEVKLIIQVGDFGWYRQTIPFFNTVKPQIPIYFIDGNHEDHVLLENYKEVTEVAPNIFFVPRGTIMELDGRRIAFMGGGSSVDKEIRLSRKLHWSAGENITPNEAKSFDGVTGKIDFFVAHVPTQTVTQKHFNPHDLVMFFGLPITWTDPNMDKVELMHMQLGFPKMVCGHMHRSIVDGKVRILDINEIWFG